MRIKINKDNIKVSPHAVERLIQRSMYKTKALAKQRITDQIKIARPQQFILPHTKKEGTILLLDNGAHLVLRIKPKVTIVTTYIDRTENLYG